MKNWLPDLFNRKKVNALELQVKAIQNIFSPPLTALLSEQVWGKGYNVNPAIYPDWSSTYSTSAYINNDQVYAVVNKIAETTSLIPFYVYYQKQEKAVRQLTSATNRQFYTSKGIIDILMLQLKALEDAPDTDPLVKLLANPNPQQSQQEFFLAAFCYYLLCGEVFIYKDRYAENISDGGKVRALYVLAPSNIILHVTKEYPQTVTGYEFVVGNLSVYKNIPVGDIIHIRKFNPDTTYGYDLLANYSRFRGLSPLMPAKKLLTRLTGADDASVAQLQNGGVPGIVFDDSGGEGPTQESLDNTRKKFYSYLTNTDNKGMPYFMGNKINYISLGLKLADMEITKLQNMDFKRLCNIYKVSTILFNSDVAATESNVKEMIKQMYTSVCLPLAYTFRDKFNHALANSDWNDKRTRFIDVDISGITELQDDYRYLAQLLADLPVTPTGNEMRELFRYDRVEDPLMDRPLVKTGYSVIDDLGFAPPNVG